MFRMEGLQNEKPHPQFSSENFQTTKNRKKFWMGKLIFNFSLWWSDYNIKQKMCKGSFITLRKQKTLYRIFS